MQTFEVLEHIPGRISMEVPSIKELSDSKLVRLLKNVAEIPAPAGIRDIRHNLLNGSVIINYEPERTNIEEFIQSVMYNPKIRHIMTGK
ncbi:MAG: hypothetical protein EPN22_11730 [Nitrospirae bacterium]|nr:MAG: hypothetical protein EPN22_11730 [Nitrospirota bacterium]